MRRGPGPWLSPCWSCRARARLSLATPTALAAATDSLLRRGVLIVQPHVLETLHRATHIVFDKTGTLTLGRPVLQQIEGLGSMTEDDCLQVAAALEAGSAHPLAQAILGAAEGLPGQQPRAHAEQLQEVQGQGLEGVVDGVRYRLGNAAFVAAIAGPPLGDTAVGVQGMTPLYLGTQGRWLTRFLLSDALRPEAREVVDVFPAARQASRAAERRPGSADAKRGGATGHRHGLRRMPAR